MAFGNFRAARDRCTTPRGGRENLANIIARRAPRGEGRRRPTRHRTSMMPVAVTTRRAFTAALAGALLAGCRGPADSPAADPAARDATAARRGEEICDRMLALYRAAKSYADRAEYVEQSAVRGEGVERETPFFQMSLAYERPNRLRLEFDEAVAASGGSKGYAIVSDGARIRTVSKEIPDQVQDAPAPDELTDENFVTDPIVQEALLSRPLGDVFPQLAMLLNEDGGAVFPRDDHPRLLDERPLAGRPCYRVASTNPDGTRVLWIDRESYVLRRMELPVEAHRRAVDPDGNYLSLAIWINFIDPLFDVEVDRKTFAMEVPPDARLVEAFEIETAKDAKGDKQEGE